VSERKHPDAICEECPLFSVGRYVPSDGPAHAELAFVGEAPGSQETRGGRPFVGPSGKLLDAVLQHHGIDRSKALLTNACLCRPPDNTTPPPAAIRACQPRLKAELSRRDVRTAVALGNTASQSLLGQTGVTKLRVGPAKPSTLVDGLRVIPTLHPAACLRQGDQFPHLVTDIGKVHYEPRIWNPPTFVVADSDNMALQLLTEIDERLTSGTGLVANPERVLVIDIEVDVEKDIAFDHPDQYGMLCVGIGYDRSRVVVLDEGVMGSQRVRNRLGQLLRKYKLVAQNGKFDLSGLFPLLGGLGLYFDTMLASYVFDERPGVHGLKYQAVEFLGAPQYDEEIKGYVGPGIGYGAIPRDLLYKYNAYDVGCTYEMYEVWRDRFEQGNEDLRRVHDHLVRASNQLMYLELNGITVDREYLKKLDVEYVESIKDIRFQIDCLMPKNYDKFGGINPNSPLQVKKYLGDMEIGVDSTDADTLQRILDYQKKLPKEDEVVRTFVRLMLQHRREAKMHGTYVKGIAKRLYRGRVHSSYLLHGTTSGRLASRNPNLQNQPREARIRRLYIPSKPENVFLSSDYAQAELRVLCFVAGDTYLRDIFNAGDIDLFDDLTPRLYTDMPGKIDVPIDLWKELRIRVKAFVYGSAYGRKAFSIAQEFGISEAEAQKLMDLLFETMPDVMAFREDVKRKVLDGEDLITPWGRHRRFALITDDNREKTMNEALAFIPQSTASDICLQALYWLRPQLKGIAYIRNMMHDALLIECHQDAVEEVKPIVERNMIESAKTIVGDYVKFEVDTKVGRSWGDV